MRDSINQRRGSRAGRAVRVGETSNATGRREGAKVEIGGSDARALRGAGRGRLGRRRRLRGSSGRSGCSGRSRCSRRRRGRGRRGRRRSRRGVRCILHANAERVRDRITLLDLDVRDRVASERVCTLGERSHQVFEIRLGPAPDHLKKRDLVDRMRKRLPGHVQLDLVIRRCAARLPQNHLVHLGPSASRQQDGQGQRQRKRQRQRHAERSARSNSNALSHGVPPALTGGALITTARP